MVGATKCRVGLATILAGFAGCWSPATEGVDALPSNGELAVVRLTSWPAGGRELTVRVNDSDGQPIGEDISSRLRATWVDGGEPVAATITATPLEPGQTLILVAPSSASEQRAATVAAIAALADLRPAGERIAIYRWGERVEQLVGFTRDRDLLLRAGAALEADLGDPEPVDSLAAVVAAAADLMAVEGPAPRGMRAMVLLAPGEMIDRVTAAAVVPPIVSGEVTSPAAAPAAMATVSQQIDELAANAHYTLGLCGPVEARSLRLSTELSAGDLVVGLPESLPEQAEGVCDPAEIGPGKRRYPTRVELIFTPEQRAIYEQHVAEFLQEDFSLSLRLDPGEAAIPAVAHLRGQSSLGCERANYNVDLDGSRGRYLFPESATDELYLISMCKDDRYIQQYTANLLMAELGLFPLEFGFVELYLDGENRGVYLMIEKTREELVGDNSRVRSVLRRRFAAPATPFELKYSRDGDPEAAVGSMTGFLASLDGLAGSELAAAVSAHFDLPDYLALIALQTALENGDYVDEVWFWSADQRDGSGSVGDYWQLMGWDVDDIFSLCHFDGQYALADPHQLAYCAEAPFDHRLLGDPFIYDLYVDRLEQLLEQVTAEHFAAAVDRTSADLLGFFDDPALCQAMVELVEDNPAAVDCAEARRDISAALAGLRADYAARHATLIERIAAYRAGGS